MSAKKTLSKSKQIAQKQDFKGQSLYFNHRISQKDQFHPHPKETPTLW